MGVIIQELRALGCEATPCGSRVTCDTAPVDTDEDWLVLADSGRWTNIVSLLHARGFIWEGDVHYQDADSQFMSWRGGEINIVLTDDPEWAARHKVATALCKRLNLMEKQDRIAVFQAVLYGEAHA